MSEPDVVVIGTGGLGRETLWALRAASRNVVGFVTSEASRHGTTVCDLPVLGDEAWLVGRDCAAVCCVGSPRDRQRLTADLEDRGVVFTSVVHPSAQLSEFVELGAGCVVGANAVITTQVTLGRHVIVGAGTIVSHDCRLDDYVTLAPGVVLAGGVQVGYGAELGAGAASIPGQRIGRGALVGARAAVIRPVEDNVVVAGVPAREIKRFPETDHL